MSASNQALDAAKPQASIPKPEALTPNVEADIVRDMASVLIFTVPPLMADALFCCGADCGGRGVYPQPINLYTPKQDIVRDMASVLLFASAVDTPSANIQDEAQQVRPTPYTINLHPTP